jgi:hypothetical protein
VARGAAPIIPAAAVDGWFSRLGLAPSAQERRLAADYVRSLGVQPGSGPEFASGWDAAEGVIRDPASAEVWWSQEEAQRRALLQQVAARMGETNVLDALTGAVEGFAESSFRRALDVSGGDEVRARVASGAALMAIHFRSLALLAGCGADHLFVQKYALFAAGRWPLGMRHSTFIIF